MKLTAYASASYDRIRINLTVRSYYIFAPKTMFVPKDKPILSLMLNWPPAKA